MKQGLEWLIPVRLGKDGNRKKTILLRNQRKKFLIRFFIYFLFFMIRMQEDGQGGLVKAQPHINFSVRSWIVSTATGIARKPKYPEKPRLVPSKVHTISYDQIVFRCFLPVVRIGRLAFLLCFCPIFGIL